MPLKQLQAIEQQVQHNLTGDNEGYMTFKPIREAVAPAPGEKEGASKHTGQGWSSNGVSPPDGLVSCSFKFTVAGAIRPALLESIS